MWIPLLLTTNTTTDITNTTPLAPTITFARVSGIKGIWCTLHARIGYKVEAFMESVYSFKN